MSSVLLNWLIALSILIICTPLDSMCFQHENTKQNKIFGWEILWLWWWRHICCWPIGWKLLHQCDPNTPKQIKEMSRPQGARFCGHVLWEYLSSRTFLLTLVSVLTVVFLLANCRLDDKLAQLQYLLQRRKKMPLGILLNEFTTLMS